MAPDGTGLARAGDIVNDAPHRFDPPIVGESPAAQRLRDLVQTLAGSDVTVLITGDSGTGKEVLARNLHRLGRRFSQPFVSVNCAALAPGILESELFGHDRGAFTGAVRSHAGLFEEANGGTIFLDEIGEIPPYIQAKLLRVLQEGEVRRMGEGAVRRVDVRLITATNADLADMITEGSFRKDLFYRINVVEARVPALRERRGDVIALVAHFFATRGLGAPAIPEETARILMAYSWPGNIRELENEVERIMALTRLPGSSPRTCCRRAMVESADATLDVPMLCEAPLCQRGEPSGGEPAQAHARRDELEQVPNRPPAGALAAGAPEEDKALRDRADRAREPIVTGRRAVRYHGGDG